MEIRSAENLPAVFGGGVRPLKISIRNPTERPVEAALQTRLFQLSSATVMPAGDAAPWKKLTVLGGQTVLETAALRWPEVRAATRFEVRWFQDANTVAGRTVVMVYPTNLLKQLSDMAGEKPLGVFDPQERLTRLLKPLQVDFIDLTEGERLESFHERLAIAGPFDARQPLTRDLRKRLLALARRGVGVVLIAPPLPAPRMPNASLLLVTERVAMIAPEAMADLESDPAAQETLLHCARLVLDPNLPFTTQEH